jgi:hypothetical protein
VSFAHDFWQDHYCQIDENEDMMEIKQHSPINIGDIQPKHHRVVHLWSSIDLSDNFFKDVKKAIRISADEVHSVKLRFPLPRYLRTKYDRLIPWLFWLLSAMVLVAMFLLAKADSAHIEA